MGMVHRQFKDLLYKTFIRPHMEFAIQALSPYLKRDIECLNVVELGKWSIQELQKAELSGYAW